MSLYDDYLIKVAMAEAEEDEGPHYGKMVGGAALGGLGYFGTRMGDVAKDYRQQLKSGNTMTGTAKEVHERIIADPELSKLSKEQMLEKMKRAGKMSTRAGYALGAGGAALAGYGLYRSMKNRD